MYPTKVSGYLFLLNVHADKIQSNYNARQRVAMETFH